jgi:hypothetical protein
MLINPRQIRADAAVFLNRRVGPSTWAKIQNGYIKANPGLQIEYHPSGRYWSVEHGNGQITWKTKHFHTRGKRIAASVRATQDAGDRDQQEQLFADDKRSVDLLLCLTISGDSSPLGGVTREDFKIFGKRALETMNKILELTGG